MKDRVRWNKKYSDPSFVPDWAPDVDLAEIISDLPKGSALDIASGMGANSLFLAKRGYRVDCLDLSDVGLELLRRAADSEGVLDRFNLILSDVASYAFTPESYDLVLCFRFYFQGLPEIMVNALKPGGVLLARMFTQGQLRYRPQWPADRVVDADSVLDTFSGLEPIDFQVRDTPEDAHAFFVGKKKNI